MPPVDIYTSRFCPYCSSAKALLKRKGVTFTEINLSQEHERREEMIARAGGRMTVPQIFIGSVHVGGCDDLHALERAGKLDALLAEQGQGEGQRRMSAGNFKAAMIQMRSGLTPAANVDAAARLIGEAKNAGADYVQTPEMTNILAAKREQLLATIVEEDADPSLAAFRELARKLGIAIHVGSLAIKISPDRAANRGFLIDAKGAIAARYDKIHMFDVDLAGGESYRESRTYRPGEQAVLADLPWGRLGITICYDLRFPALYRALAEAGATLLAIPSAFTVQTGEAHWHVLMRARAIENGSFVFAAAQAGKHESGRETFGHSLIVDPWGRILAEGGTEPGVVMAEIDMAEVTKARSRIPSLEHGRRFELVEPLAEPTHLHVVGNAE